MKPKDILLLGVHAHVVAFEKATGQRLWDTALKNGLGVDFVTVFADDARVFAHTGGELFCLDLATGRVLWHDKLAGLGYGFASLTAPGAPATDPVLAAAARQRASETTAASTT